MIQLTHEEIDQGAVLAAVQSPLAGACVLFLGVTREVTAGRVTTQLEYQAYEPMARSELQAIRDKAMTNWQLVEVCIAHRLGSAPIGTVSVAVAVSSAHRAAAFQAAAWIMDELKAKVPIWKQEQWADGTSEWIHPSGASGLPQDAQEIKPDAPQEVFHSSACTHPAPSSDKGGT